MPDDVRPERDEEQVRRFVEHTAMTMADWGFPRMPARVLLAMMTADESSLTAADIGERLNISPAAVSGAVRYLLQVGLLVREPVPGSRRAHYRMLDDAWYEASVSKQNVLKAVADLADDGVGALGGPSTPAGARVAEMRDFFRYANDELSALLDGWYASKREREGDSARP